MAIVKVGVWTDPPDVGSYAAISAHLEAYAKQVTERQDMIANRAAAASIALGSYISHGGTLYQVQTDAYAVTGTPTAGKNYIQVAASGSTLVLSLITNISGFSYNPLYNGWYDVSENQLLPYLVNYAGATYGYAIHDYNQATGFIDGLDYDLVISSDADLALLYSGGATGTFQRVGFVAGTYDAAAYITLAAYDVEVLDGNGAIISFSVVAGSSAYLITCDDVTRVIRNLRITSSVTQTQDTALVIFAKANCLIENVRIYGMSNKTVGVLGPASVIVRDCMFTDLYQGIDTCSAIRCVFTTCYVGIEGAATAGTSGEVVGCRAITCDIGFNAVKKLTGCYASGATVAGFYLCRYMSACVAEDNVIGFDQCLYMSSCWADVNTTEWYGCTNVDYDSTNCDQQWTYGNSGANVTTSGWVLPRGKYQLVKTGSGAVYIDVYDGSNWIQCNSDVRSTLAFAGIVESDGVNVRLRGASATETVYWRKQP